MAFTVEDFQDLVRILGDHPEWQGQLRRLVLPDQLVELPELVRDLAEAQHRTEQAIQALAEAQRRTEEQIAAFAQRVDRLEQAVEGLAKAQRRTEEQLAILTQRVDRLEQVVEELAEAQRHTEQQVRELAEAQRHTEQQVRELAEAQRRTEQQVQTLTQHFERFIERFDRLTDDVGMLKEITLEWQYRDRAPAYFGTPRFHRARALSCQQLDRLLAEGVERGELTWEEQHDIVEADLVVKGRLPDRTEAYLVVEISWGVGASDVHRAIRRADRLRKVRGFERVFPAVAGRWIGPEAREIATHSGVVQVIDGAVTWPEGNSKGE